MAEFVLRDIRLPMRWDSTGYPAPAEGYDVDEQNIRNVLLTTPGERVHRPNFGSHLHRLVHKNLSTRLFILIIAEIRRAIRTHLPKLAVLGVDFRVTTDNRIEATIDWDRVENIQSATRKRRRRVLRTTIDLGRRAA